MPSAPVEVQSGLIACEPAALSGRALRQEVRLHFSNEKGSHWTDLLFYLPMEAHKRVPLFVGSNL